MIGKVTLKFIKIFMIIHLNSKIQSLKLGCIHNIFQLFLLGGFDYINNGYKLIDRLDVKILTIGY